MQNAFVTASFAIRKLVLYVILFSVLRLVITFFSLLMRFSKFISVQQSKAHRHHKPLMYFNKLSRHLIIGLLLSFLAVTGGCSIFKPSEKHQSPTLLKTENATQEQLIEKVNNLAQVNSMYAKMDLKLEDNSYAELGIAEKYKTADGVVVVQRPANIQLKVQVPFIKTDVAQMTSDGEKFRVAILEDGGSGKYKNFVIGTNNADYSILQKEIANKIDENGNSKELKQNVNVFANLRPQHFTDAILVKAIDETNHLYIQSTILQQEENLDVGKKSPLRRVLRGYYLLDEVHKNPDGTLSITRRFWFDRVGSVRIARQQIFDDEGEIESDIVYGQEGSLTDTGEYNNLPLRIELTRPKEKYKMRLTYQSPADVSIGKTYPQEAFVLENRWNLTEIDLDQKLREMTGNTPPAANKVNNARAQ